MTHIHGWRLSSLALVALPCLLATAPLAAQSTVVHWVGPEPACDYATIQEGIDDVFGGFIPPFGFQVFRLSANYNHRGQIQIRDSLGMSGGWSGCGGSFTGARKSLSPQAASALVLVLGPSSGSIDVILSHLNLFGASETVSLGGVVLMAGGGARLTLENVGVTGGRAEKGGGIAMVGEGKVLELIDVDVADNDAVLGDFGDGDGGGVYRADGGVIEYVSGSIRENTATTRGGGVFLEGCVLRGDEPGRHRSFVGNRVTRAGPSQAYPGKGGGIYAGGPASRVELGAVRSRTIFDGNGVARWLHSERAGARAHGGGLHLQRSATAVLRNVRFVENEAPDGGGVSLESGASLDMDRTSGPCAVARASACSAFIGNGASGSGGRYAGKGAAVLRFVGGGELSLRRTELRQNTAFYWQHDDVILGSMISIGGGPRVVLDGNLIFSNTLASDAGRQFLTFAEADGLHLTGNTIAFNGDADAFYRYNGGPELLELTGNVFWEPVHGLAVSAENVPAQLSVCNVSHRAIPAEASSRDEVADPEFVDSGVADFHLLSGSPAIDGCQEGDDLGQLEATFDIEGRARPASDGPAGFLPYDAGAFEHHEGPPNEVDLAVSLERVNDPDTLGATFEAVLSNVGLTTAAPGNFDVWFRRPPREYATEGWTSCVEEDAGEQIRVRCSIDVAGGLRTLAATIPLRVSVAADAVGECGLDVFTDSGTQPDTDPRNDSASERVECGPPDLIFQSGFEGGDTAEWNATVGGP